VGLFNFIKNAGKKILGKGDNNKEIETLIETNLIYPGQKIRIPKL
jgi:nucleoid-associated protein YgaU